jgi:heptosyltransferase-1
MAVERFRELALHFPGRTVAAWGPGEKPLAQAIGGDIAPDTNLRELAWLLANASAVVAGDTGPLHLAAALGAKVIGLYGPTDPRRNGPVRAVGPGHRPLRRQPFHGLDFGRVTCFGTGRN